MNIGLFFTFCLIFEFSEPEPIPGPSGIARNKPTKKQSAKKPGAKSPQVSTNSSEAFREQWGSIATRLSRLINDGDLSIASQSILAKGCEKLMLGES